MILAISALDVAFVSALAALAAALVAPLITLIVTVLRHRHERRLRVYEDKRDAYMELLRQVEKTLATLGAIRRAVAENDPSLYRKSAPPPLELLDVLEREASVRLFGSARVNKALDRWAVELSAIESEMPAPAVVDLAHDAEARGIYVATMDDLRARLKGSADEVRKAVREDMAL